MVCPKIQALFLVEAYLGMADLKVVIYMQRLLLLAVPDGKEESEEVKKEEKEKKEVHVYNLGIPLEPVVPLL